mmetsp:Transcript_15135/g.22003  ORF Transcript_15135/g.22003 Transcript_15135/m.22003 type:complete len:313 (+) Transcript_15135:65-1003(+)
MKYQRAALSIAMQILSARLTSAFSLAPMTSRVSTRIFSTTDESKVENAPSGNGYDSSKSPWAPENQVETKKKGNSRFRQHVNPLARKFMMPTELGSEWPNDGTFTNPKLPLHIDIGCGKGGFLLTLATERVETPNKEEGERNYLGLEIRPSVSKYAKERVDKWNLSGKVDFIGCNANVDLERILEKYAIYGEVGLVSVQYPDPHFKKSHQKRRVLTPQLVHTLAKYMKEGREIFIQSDIKDVFDNMRETVREFGDEYFIDAISDIGEYMDENPVGVPTEREVSVLDQDLPVYRTVFTRNSNDLKVEEKVEGV